MAYHHGNLKAALTEAALAVVAETGLEAFTLREVARRAGVSHNAPYRHFKSREDLVAALATAGLRRLNQQVLKSVNAAKTPPEKLHAAARAYLRFGLKNPPEFAVVFHGKFERQDYPDYVAAYSESLEILTGLTGSEKLGDLVWATVHGITELGIAQRLRSVETLARFAIDTILTATSKRGDS